MTAIYVSSKRPLQAEKATTAAVRHGVGGDGCSLLTLGMCV